MQVARLPGVGMRNHHQKDRRNNRNCRDPKPRPLLSEGIHLFARSVAANDLICQAFLAAKDTLLIGQQSPRLVSRGLLFSTAVELSC